MRHWNVHLIRKTACLLLCSLIFLAACVRGGSDTLPLTDTSWVLVGIEQSGMPDSLIPGNKITAVFTPTQLSGTSGCNHYGGPYSINGSTIQISELASTAMDCPSLLMEQESQFLEALRQAVSFSLVEDELVIETAVSTLIFHKLQPLPLAGTNWQLTGIAQDGVVIGTWVDEGITAVFTDGALSGKAGCNDYFGSYRQEGDYLAISEIGSTKMACDETRNQRETQFLNVLSTTAGYTTTQDSLTLQDANNNTLLTFTQTLSPNPLSSVIWKLVALETADGPLPTQGTLITAQFIDESVAGIGGCNPYAANYFLVADAYLLLLNDIGHGFEICDNRIQQLETTFFSLLETAESFTLDNNTLTIFSQRGTLAFTAAPFSSYQPPFVMLPDGIRCSRTTIDDPLIVNDKQRRYICFQSGSEMTILIGDFQPDTDGWLTEKAIITGTEEDFQLKQTDLIRVTLP